MSNEVPMEFANEDSSVQVLQDTVGGNSENVLLGQLGGKFQSRENLISTLKGIFSMQGYVLSIKGSRKDKYVDIGCDRGGSYRNTWQIPMEKRKKNTATRLINCPFLIKGKRIEDGSWINSSTFDELLQGLEVCYKKLPPNRREEARGTISQLVTPSPLFLYEPNIQKHKGRPSGSKKRKVSSTRRDPSKFEIVEATRKCSFCDGVGHYIQTCKKKFEMNKTPASGSNKETNMIDLNVAPCSSDSVLMEL